MLASRRIFFEMGLKSGPSSFSCGVFFDPVAYIELHSSIFRAVVFCYTRLRVLTTKPLSVGSLATWPGICRSMWSAIL